MKKKVKTDKKIREIVLKGQPISPGIAIGKALLLADDYIETKKVRIPEDAVQEEIEKFKKAIEDTILDFEYIIDQVGTRISAHKREIFNALLMILEDSHITEETIGEIKDKKINADYAYFTIMRNYQRNLKAAGDIYLKERAVDIQDIKRRVIRKIQGVHREQTGDLSDTVVCARELNIFDVIALANDNAQGVIFEGGGRTTHTTIMIRALELPGIIGVSHALQIVNNSDIIIADGLTGEIIIKPKQTTLNQYIRKRSALRKIEQKYVRVAALPSVSRDKVPFIVNANIELHDEVDSVVAHGEFGIGLFRTEYTFMAEDRLPTEEEQYEKYSAVAKKIQPLPVTIRTIDLGGDKVVPFLDTELEHNPFLGWRAIRICLDMPDIFRKQLRAILRASVWGNVRLLFPLITSLDEIYKVKYRIEEAKTELLDQNIDFDPNIPVGIMVEVPSTVMLAERFAQEIDFFSIGTNDLIQYTLAVDRGNAKVANLYNAFHPSVLRMIKLTVQAGKKYNIPVGMCGEMAGDPLATLLLFGLGVSEFSVSPIMLPKIKQILRSVDYTEAKKVSTQCMRFYVAHEVESYLHKVMHKFFPRMDENNYYRGRQK